MVKTYGLALEHIMVQEKDEASNNLPIQFGAKVVVCKPLYYVL